jgi:signal transduction histidine kinase
MGLALTHKIITAHGGRIEVESRDGEGTKFTVTLPKA